MLNTLQEWLHGESPGSIGQECELINVIARTGLIYFRGDDPDKYCPFYDIIY